MSFIHDILAITTAGASALLAYHHIGFPVLLRAMTRRKSQPTDPTNLDRGSEFPSMTVFMPAHNEAHYIAAKLRNLAQMDYPERLLRVIVVCDGCTDATASIARATLLEPALSALKAEIIEEPVNRGKIAVLNRYLPTIPTGIIAISDVSAHLERDALRRASVHFEAPEMGVVAATYRLSEGGSAGEMAYWRYQIKNKIGEARMGAPLGVHGALYFIRAGDFTQLKADTINDDFIIPMRLVAAGKRAVYDTEIVATEQEVADQTLDFNRRIRIAAGNLQQLLRVPRLLSPRLGHIALAFFSGKALRAIAPFLLAVMIIGSAALSATSPLWLAFFASQCTGIAMVLMRHLYVPAGRSRLLDIIHYIAVGYMAGFIGGVRYLLGMQGKVWTRATEKKEFSLMNDTMFQPKGLALAKRGFDIIGATVGLALSATFAPLICLAIKLDSPGPVIFHQVRVGRSWPTFTELFTMYKFRTMRTDAETVSGPVWASKNDPRITRVGRFLRKTRLDEIPQLVNVLKGEMSLIGPRPERPGICDKLETAIPFYAERTYGVRPGITGLAQVFQGYDETIEDVRSKVSYDHAYALAAGSWKTWMRIDFEILLRTVTVVVFGRGQ